MKIMKQPQPQSELMIRGVRLEDINDCYMLACENSKIYDEFLEMDILSRDFPTDDEFDYFVRRDNVRGIIADRSIPLSNKTNVSCRSFAGFCFYEILDTSFGIRWIEVTEKNDTKVYRNLLNNIIQKARGLNKSVIYPIEDDKTSSILYPLLTSLLFTKRKWVHSEKSEQPDIIVMERSADAK